MIHFKLCVRVILNRFSFRGDIDCDSQRDISLSLLSIVDVALQDLVGPQSTWVDPGGPYPTDLQRYIWIRQLLLCKAVLFDRVF